MNYFDPFQLLEIRDVTSIDTQTIEKAKKSFLAEIDSSEHIYKISGYKIDKSAFLQVFDDLNDPQRRAFHVFIHQKKPLLKFLLYGSLAYFKEPKEAIYDDPEFVSFISPYFAFQYDRLLGRGVQEKNLPAIELLLANTPLVNNEYLPRCYTTAQNWLKDKTRQVEQYADNADQYAEQPEKLLAQVKQAIDPQVFNLLPVAWFQQYRNEAAAALGQLAVVIQQHLKDSPVAMQVSEHALELQTEEAVVRKLKEQYRDLRQTPQVQPPVQSQSELLSHHYIKVPAELQQLIKLVESKQVEPNTALHRLNGLFEVEEMNALPASYNDLRDATAVQLNNLAITIWNEFSGIEAALTVINRAAAIRMTQEANTEQVLGTKKDLEALNHKMLQHHESQIDKAVGVLRNLKLALAGADGVKLKPEQATERLDSVFAPVFIDFLLSTKAVNKRLLLFDETTPVLRLLSPSAPAYVRSLLNRLRIVAAEDDKLASRLQAFEESLVQKADTRRNNQHKELIRNGVFGFILILLIAGGWWLAVRNGFSLADFMGKKDQYRVVEAEREPQLDPGYEYVKLEDGEIGDCANGLQRWDSTSNNQFTITAGERNSLVAKLVDKATGKPVRYIYISQNKDYTMNNIPDGDYYLRIAFGSKWTRPKGQAACEGKFIGKSTFQEIEKIYEFKPKESGLPFVHQRLTVNSKDGDTLNQVKIKELSEPEFYQKKFDY